MGADIVSWEKISDTAYINKQYPLLVDQYVSKSFAKQLSGYQNNQSLPSGISNLYLKAKDHILFFVDSDSDHYIADVASFLAAGLENPTYNEICTLETSDHWNRERLELEIRKRTPYDYTQKLDIITWEVGYEPYVSDKKVEKQEFVPSTMQGVFFTEMYKARQNYHSNPENCARIVSEDSGQFLRSLANPREYLIYEGRLADDLKAAFKTPILQMCIYKNSDIQATSNELGKNHITRDEILIRLVATHGKFLYKDSNNNLLTDRKAKRLLLSKVDWKKIPPSSYFTALKVLFGL